MSSAGGSGSRSILARIRARARVRTVAVDFVLRTETHIGHPPSAEVHRGLRAVGNDPIRVLVCGGGVCSGFGVDAREDALDGALVRALAESTGRGVVVENRCTGADVDTADVMHSLGAVGTHTFGLVVWGMSYLEAVRVLAVRRYGERFAALVGELRVERPVPIIVVPIPLPTGAHPMALLVRPWTTRLNRVIERRAARLPMVECAEPTPIAVRDVESTRPDRAFYDAAGTSVAAAYSRLRERARVPVPSG